MRHGFIGTGTMGKMLIEKFLKSGKINASETYIFNRSSEKLNELEKKFGVNVCTSISEVVGKANVIYICVKPQDLKEVISELQKFDLENKLIVSIVAAVKSDFYKQELRNLRLIRVVPSVTNEISEGVVLYSVCGATKEDENLLCELLSSLGQVYKVKEDEIDVFTHLTSCGPALIAKFLEMFLESLENEGLQSENREKILFETVNGTVKLLEKEGFGIISKVCTEKGITQEGVKVLTEIQPVINKMTRKLSEKQSIIKETVMQNENSEQ